MVPSVALCGDEMLVAPLIGFPRLTRVRRDMELGEDAEVGVDFDGGGSSDSDALFISLPP